MKKQISCVLCIRTNCPASGESVVEYIDPSQCLGLKIDKKHRVEIDYLIGATFGVVRELDKAVEFAK